MESVAILTPVILSFFILVIPSGARYLYSLVLSCLIILVTSWPALGHFIHPDLATQTIPLFGPLGELTLTLDGLSSFFILVTNFTVLTGLIYSNGYLKSATGVHSSARVGLHYFSYAWLHLSMLAVLVLREATSFLIAWELMAVSSFMLILFEAEKRETLKTAVQYLVQMHIGLVVLLIAFLLAWSDTGIFGFDGLREYFSVHPNLPLFALFFAGFAIKAGFIPFHTWLPRAHPTAPSHVSGVMSGVMIKMGIYGILRVLSSIQSDHYQIGIVIMVVSVFTGLFGIMMAIVQSDLKKLLAYSTIENVGIIGIGIGLGVLGIGAGNPLMAILGFTGGLFHLLNHSLFKSLLFYGAGSVYKATHTRNVNLLGGLVHKMPGSTGLFLFGSVAICALPPLNGFISELVIYYGLFAGMSSSSVFQSMSMLLTILALAMIGGLSLFGFSKAFGITFLGSNRSGVTVDEKAVTWEMVGPKLLIALVILFISLLPVAILQPLLALTGVVFHLQGAPDTAPVVHTISRVSLMGAILLILTGILYFIRNTRLKRVEVTKEPTWGCGYTAGTVRQQYTGASFSANFEELGEPILSKTMDYQEMEAEEIFPSRRSFGMRFTDVFGTALNWMANYSMLGLKRIARLQTGNIQHYILYAFIFMLFIFILLYLKLL